VTGEPGRCAQQAAEAVWALNHATLPGAGGLGGPADVYDVLGALASLVARLPQALGQLQGFLDVECEAGRVAVVEGDFAGDPVAAVATTGTGWTGPPSPPGRCSTPWTKPARP